MPTLTYTFEFRAVRAISAHFRFGFDEIENLGLQEYLLLCFYRVQTESDFDSYVLRSSIVHLSL